MRARDLFRWRWLVSSILLVSAIAGIAQTPPAFVYVFPKFSADSSAELILSNLSQRLVTADISFYDPTGGVSTVYAEVAAKGQMRATASDFVAQGARNFDGTVVVRASGPLSAQAKVPVAGGFKTLEPSAGSRNLIVPFSQGTLGTSEVSVYNESGSTVSVVLIAVGANGTPIGSTQVAVGGHATRRDLLQNVISAVLSSSNRETRDVSHVLVRVPNNVFGSDRRVFVLASLTQFADLAEGVRQRSSDTTFVQAVPESSASLSSTVPLFVEGGGYYSLVQVINASQLPSTATLTAHATNGSVIGENNPVVLALPAGGAIRRSVQSLFNLPATTTVGSITVDSATPVVTSGVLGTSTGGFVVTPSAPAANTNFVFAVDAPNTRFFTALTLLNTSGSPATVTIRALLDDGTAIARNTQLVDAQGLVTGNLNQFVPEFRNNGFVHLESDVPITASALYGRSDNSILATLATMHSQPDYIPPDPVTFVVRGVVRHNNVPFPGIVVQLTGLINGTAVTDELGNYVFPNVPNGSYTVRVAANGYSFNPSSTSVSIQNDSSRGNDFAASLIPPLISFVQPKAIVMGSASTQLIVTGTPLIASSEIVFEGRAFPTALSTADIPINGFDPTGSPAIVNQTFAALKATLDAESIAVPRVASVIIRNSGPGGSVSSAPMALPIGSPAPVLTSFGTLPQPLLAGNPGFITTLTGTGFAPGVTAMVQGVSRPTTYLNSTTVQVIVPPEDLATGKFLKVTAINPQPTIGPSNALDLAVLNPTPGLLALSPSSAEVRLEANAPSIQITVTGFGFKDGAKIRVGSFEIPTTYVRATTLIGQIPQNAMQIGGAFSVVVSNPQPAVATSEALPFLLINLPPALNSIDPGVLFFDSSRPEEIFTAPVVMRGSNFGPNTAFELTAPCVPPDDSGSSGGIPGSAGGSGSGSGGSTGSGGSGSGSGSGSGGSTVSSSLVNSHEAILFATIACTGTYQVRVRTPQPGGGISQTLAFTVSDYSAPSSPVISSLSPNTAPARSASFTLTITGANFQNGAVVSFGSAVLFPSSIQSSSITVTVPSYLLTIPDVVPVVVTNPSTAGSSNRVLFTVF